MLSAVVSVSISMAAHAAALTNGGFETLETIELLPIMGFGSWAGDPGFVVSAENGIVPVEGDRMLQFKTTFQGGQGGQAASVWQLIDLSDVNPLPTTAEFSASFNRIPSGPTAYEIRFLAFAGPLQSFPGNINQALATATGQFDTDVDPKTWQVLSGSLALPPNTTYLGVEVAALSPNPVGGYVDNAVLTWLNPASIVGRHLFYNNSKFDGNDPSLSAADDAAIAPDKSALLPGGRASFANYTSLKKGINGIAIDIENAKGDLTASDFQFRVGNSDDPSTWSSLAVEPTILVRHGAGENGSDRVELIFPTGTVLKEWLQVTIKADANTGLTASDVFYFGNAIGESGNADSIDLPNAMVNAADEIAARNDPHNILNPATIANPHDYDRNGFVNAADQITARNNGTTFLNALRLITVPATLAAAPVPEPSTLVLAVVAALCVIVPHARPRRLWSQ